MDQPPTTPPTKTPRRSPWTGILAFVIVVALAAGAYAARNIFAGTRGGGAERKRGPQTVPVVTALAKVGDLPIYLDCLGTVTAFNVATIRSRVDGELVKLHFREGQMVKTGDLLAEIDPRPFEVQLAQATGNLERDQATLANAQSNEERDRSLRRTNAISPQEYEASLATLNQAKGAVAADRAQVDNAKLNLTYSKIIAPFAGRIGLRKVDIGNYIRASDVQGLLVVVQTQPIAVVFTVPQDAVARVQRRQSQSPLAVEIHGREIGTPLATGTVLAIDNQIDPASGTVRVKATVPNQDEALFPNEFVSVRLLLETRRGAVIAPSAAVRHGPENDFVYVVKSDETVEMRPVRVGVVEGDLALIERGVSDGEMVVTQGIDKLQPGAKVESHPASAEGKASEGKGRRGKAPTISGRPKQGDEKRSSDKGTKSSDGKASPDKSPGNKAPAKSP